MSSEDWEDLAFVSDLGIVEISDSSVMICISELCG
jgi:hypothetical protein